MSDNQLQATVRSILSDIDVRVNSNDIEDFHRFDKPKTKSKKTIIRLVNRKFYKKALLKRKNLADQGNSKYQLHRSTKIFKNENLASMNESTAYKSRNLKRIGILHGSYTRNGVVHVKNSDQSNPIQIHQMNIMYDLPPNFHFSYHNDQDEELLHDASQDASISFQYSF